MSENNEMADYEEVSIDDDVEEARPLNSKEEKNRSPLDALSSHTHRGHQWPKRLTKALIFVAIVVVGLFFIRGNVDIGSYFSRKCRETIHLRMA